MYDSIGSYVLYLLTNLLLSCYLGCTLDIHCISVCPRKKYPTSCFFLWFLVFSLFRLCKVFPHLIKGSKGRGCPICMVCKGLLRQTVICGFGLYKYNLTTFSFLFGSKRKFQNFGRFQQTYLQYIIWMSGRPDVQCTLIHVVIQYCRSGFISSVQLYLLLCLCGNKYSEKRADWNKNISLNTSIGKF